MHSDLQKIFDLSYDQYLNITTPLVHELVDECLGTAPSMGLEYDVEDMRVVDLLFALDTFYQLTPDQRRVLDHDFDFEMPSRTIPQSVKDAVWRRDEGKCAQCGSQEFLEYDHVVPFSKGGANTYRNIQLLCQDCNRSKGANV